MMACTHTMLRAEDNVSTGVSTGVCTVSVWETDEQFYSQTSRGGTERSFGLS